MYTAQGSAGPARRYLHDGRVRRTPPQAPPPRLFPPLGCRKTKTQHRKLQNAKDTRKEAGIFLNGGLATNTKTRGSGGGGMEGQTAETQFTGESGLRSPPGEKKETT